MYSVVNIATVVRDLSRHPRGGALAIDLRHVFALDARGLAELDGRPGAAQARPEVDRLTVRAAAQTSALDLLADVRQASDVAGLAAWTSSLDLLERAPMGGAVELLRWVREELLESGWRREGDLAVSRWPVAVDVVAAGLLATWVDAPAAGEAWRWWTRAHRPATVAEPGLARLVDLVRGAQPPDLHAAGAAMGAARAGGWSWAASMHDACWAIELTGRGRDVAVAQLEALGAVFDLAGPAPLPAEVVAAVTAAVHATAVADVVGSRTLAEMCRPLLAHVG